MIETNDFSRKRPARIEQHTIYQIPPDQRHGKAAHLFTLWVGANINVLTVVTGALAMTVFGQSFLAGGIAIVAGLTGRASTVIVLLFAPGVAVAGAICLYGGALAVITLVQTFATGWRASARARALIATGIFATALLIGLVGAADFLSLYGRFNEILLYLMVPWTAVNLVDYYLIRHGHYDVESFFAADGGVYGRYNVAALGCYLFGILVQVPFIASDVYTGPIARAMGGVDLSWIAGLLAVSASYYLAAKRSAGTSARN